MKQIVKPTKPKYGDLKIKHYELRLCGGSVEPGRKTLKASV
ncbi:hypothetical protein [Xiamenia xianingshaonis]|nr:hypothetical protein [Xiamenia xianingshaonis]